MTMFKELPILLVSAGNKNAADYITSELVDEEATDVDRDENDAPDRVWRIVNKYYRADVRVHARIDGEPLAVDSRLVEGHLVYLDPNECRAEVLERRITGVRSAVSVVAAECDAESLHDAALAHRAELVPLHCAEPDDDCGLPRLRAALHAHTWRGLTLHERAVPAPLSPPSPDSELSELSDGEEWVWGSVRRASLSEPREERVSRAEELMRALRLL